MKTNTKSMLNAEGFSLIEVLVAMFVLTVGIFALYSMQISSIRGNQFANLVTQSSGLSSLQLERALAAVFDDNTLQDRNNNGTRQDLDKDGIDDGGDNFGLDDLGADADYQMASRDGNYNTSYNVAVDVPIEGIKQIRVHTRSNINMMQTPVSYNLLKNDGV